MRGRKPAAERYGKVSLTLPVRLLDRVRQEADGPPHYGNVSNVLRVLITDKWPEVVAKHNGEPSHQAAPAVEETGRAA